MAQAFLRRSIGRALATATPAPSIHLSARYLSLLAPAKTSRTLPTPARAALFQIRWASDAAQEQPVIEEEVIDQEEVVDPEESLTKESAEYAPEEAAATASETETADPVAESSSFSPEAAPTQLNETSAPPSDLRPRQESNFLYVGNLFFDVNESDVRREFSRFGTVQSCKIIFDNRGLSRGFGYVEMASTAEASQARLELDRQVFEGRRLTVQFALDPNQRHSLREHSRPGHARPANPPSRTLFVGNLSFQMTDQDLNDLFRPIRGVIDVRVAIDRRTGQPRGFAHADFVDLKSSSTAKEALHGKEIYGRNLRVDYGVSSRRIGDSGAPKS